MSGCGWIERACLMEAASRTLGYSQNHWGALTVNLCDGDVPVDNNHIENLMRPWVKEQKAWLFAGSHLAGQCAAIVMSQDSVHSTGTTSGRTSKTFSTVHPPS